MFPDHRGEHLAIHVIDVAGGADVPNHRLESAATIVICDRGPIGVDPPMRARRSERLAKPAMPVEYCATRIEPQRLQSGDLSTLAQVRGGTPTAPPYRRL